MYVRQRCVGVGEREVCVWESVGEVGVLGERDVWVRGRCVWV